jgi:alanyl-tRNA synthetase
MKLLNTNEIRQEFLNFFEKKNHSIMPSSNLIPENDPTLLFSNAGMNQFKDYFLGNQSPKFKRAATSQKCIRAGGKHNDLENVGYTARHHTFFEMLGNFSFGDYFKHDAIHFAWELLTKNFNIPEDKLLVTVYHEDTEAYNIWKNDIKLSSEKIIKIGDKSKKYDSDNFWMMGETGPCGPCSEIFYDHGEEIEGGRPGSKNEDGDRFIEIWNLVFMQYNMTEDGQIELLPKPSVDTGMGLERISAVLQNVHTNYDIDIFQNLIKDSAEITACSDHDHPSLKVISDHIRSIVFLINDGAHPSNEGRGYVLRRIMRRAIRHGYKLGCKKPFLFSLVSSVEKNMQMGYPEIKEKVSEIEKIIQEEEIKFFETIESGMHTLDEEIARLKHNNLTKFSGIIAFKLHDTYGFPVDLTKDICKENKIILNQEEFDFEMDKQKNQAKSSNKFKANKTIKINEKPTKQLAYSNSSNVTQILAIIHNDELVNQATGKDNFGLVVKETSFYAESGGQVGDSGIIFNDDTNFKVIDTYKDSNNIVIHYGFFTNGAIKINDQVNCQVDEHRRNSIKRNHSATHLLHKALKIVLGDHVLQKGSLVDDKRTRFDFSHDEKLMHDEIIKVEQIVNDEILKNEKTHADIMSINEAKKSGAMMLFGEKYDDEVRVLTIGNSKELCGGTHVSSTGDIGLFKIISENGVSSGIRRIEASSGLNLIEIINKQDRLLSETAEGLKTSKDEISSKIKQLVNQIKINEKEINQLKQKITNNSKTDLLDNFEVIDGVQVLTASIDNIEVNQLRNLIDDLKNKVESGVIILASKNDNKINAAVGVTKNISNIYHAGKIASSFAEMIGGKGGGKAEMAMAGGQKLQALSQALDKIKQKLKI